MVFKDFARKSALSLGKSLLVTLIGLSILLSAFSQATSESFVRPVLSGVIDKQFSGLNLGEEYSSFSAACSQSPNKVYGVEGIDGIKLNCGDASKGKDYFIDSLKAQATSFLLKDYNSQACNGFGCISLATDSSKDFPARVSAILNKGFSGFLEELSKWATVLSMLLVVLILVLSEGFVKKLLNLSYPLIIAGLPYFILLLGKGQIDSSLNGQLANLVSSDALVKINSLIGSTSNKFLSVFFLGIILLIFGLILKFKAGNKKGKSDKKSKK